MAFKKNHTPWNKGLKGYTNAGTFKLGHKTNLGRKFSAEFGAKIRERQLGIAFQKGSNHWNWKGGITSKERAARMKFRHLLQIKVFERDNYTCQLCGTKGNLQVDHIQPWEEYVEQRFNIDNCRTLCAGCHYQITFGKPMPQNIKGWGHNLVRRIYS